MTCVTSDLPPPRQLIARLGVEAILSAMPSVHRDNTDMPQGEAEMAYIREASSMEAPHNLHLYRLKRRKSDPTGTVLLGICPNGIELYQVSFSEPGEAWERGGEGERCVIDLRLYLLC